MLIILVLSIASCNRKPRRSTASENDTEDFNVTEFSWFSSRFPIMAADEGLYFIWQEFLYYADLKTHKYYPLCFKLGCLHEDEDNMLDCDACVGANLNGPGTFLGQYKGRLYMCAIDHEEAEMRNQLVSMEMDGSARKILIENMNGFDPSSMVFHRGYLYYTANDQQENGEFVQQIRRIPIDQIDQIDKKSEVLVSVNRKEKHFNTGTPFLPVKDTLYYTEEYSGEDMLADLLCYDLATGEERLLEESQMLLIYGAVGDHLILLTSDGQHIRHLEYSLEKEDFSEAAWLNKLQEQHPEWTCQAGCINEDFALIFAVETDGDKLLTMDPDLKAVDRQGNLLCEIEDGAHAWTSPQIKTIKGEKYLVMFGPDYVRNNTLNLYKVSDLLQGKAEPQRIHRQ